MSNTDKWQRYYIDNGITNGPVNGEQYFVEEHVRQKLKLKLLPNAWFTRWMSSENNGMTEKQYRTWQYNITKKYCDLTGNDYLFMGDFHSDIKFIHFTHMLNKPHSWKHYSEYT